MEQVHIDIRQVVTVDSVKNHEINKKKIQNYKIHLY